MNGLCRGKDAVAMMKGAWMATRRFSLFKADRILNQSDRAELFKISITPGVTVDELHERFLAKGFMICRTAVGNWQRENRRIEPVDVLVHLLRANRFNGDSLIRIESAIRAEIAD